MPPTMSSPSSEHLLKGLLLRHRGTRGSAPGNPTSDTGEPRLPRCRRNRKSARLIDLSTKIKKRLPEESKKTAEVICRTIYFLTFALDRPAGKGSAICHHSSKRLKFMEIKIINSTFTVCKVSDYSEINLKADYCFIGKTDEELSLVCETKDTPSHVLEKEDGWKAFRIQGVLDFALVGILSRISRILAENEIGIFAVSTYNTDYILTKEANFPKAIELLKRHGYTVL